METPFRIEPTLLDEIPAQIADLIAELATATAKLESALAPQTARSLVEMVRIMNTYYSNLIEGNVTMPRDIELALQQGVPSASPAPSTAQIELALSRRSASGSDLLTEAVAHVRVQREIDELAAREGLPEPASIDFIQWLHRSFYDDASDAMLTISGANRSFRMTPGEWRRSKEQDVTVGRHLPPSSDSVPMFMAYFSEKYIFQKMGKATAIHTLAAAHHRFNYIHPFPDGNGRVSRLMSHAMAHKAGIGAHGLWSISRGLARGIKSRSDYKLMMELADRERQGDLDGRGNLSLSALLEFTRWFLEVCLDQVNFMASLFDLRRLDDRLSQCAMLLGLKAEGARLLKEALVRGSFDRGEASRITGLPDRSARRVLAKVIDAGLLQSKSAKGPVFLKFPMTYQDQLFPLLFLAS